MLARVDSAELSEMLAEMEWFPWGDEREDWRAAHQAATTLGAAGVKADVADYLIRFTEPMDEDEREAELWGKISSAFASIGIQPQAKR